MDQPPDPPPGQHAHQLPVVDHGKPVDAGRVKERRSGPQVIPRSGRREQVGGRHGNRRLGPSPGRAARPPELARPHQAHQAVAGHDPDQRGALRSRQDRRERVERHLWRHRGEVALHRVADGRAGDELLQHFLADLRAAGPPDEPAQHAHEEAVDEVPSHGQQHARRHQPDAQETPGQAGGARSTVLVPGQLPGDRAEQPAAVQREDRGQVDQPHEAAQQPDGRQGVPRRLRCDPRCPGRADRRRDHQGCEPEAEACRRSGDRDRRLPGCRAGAALRRRHPAE